MVTGSFKFNKTTPTLLIYPWCHMHSLSCLSEPILIRKGPTELRIVGPFDTLEKRGKGRDGSDIRLQIAECRYLGCSISRRSIDHVYSTTAMFPSTMFTIELLLSHLECLLRNQYIQGRFMSHLAEVVVMIPQRCQGQQSILTTFHNNGINVL